MAITLHIAIWGTLRGFMAAYPEMFIGQENLRLNTKSTVNVGDDKLYVSFARFEPVSTIIAMGADLSDAAAMLTGRFSHALSSPPRSFLRLNSSREPSCLTTM